MSAQNPTIHYYDTQAKGVFDRYRATDMDRLQSKLYTWLKDCRKVLELGSGAGREAYLLGG